MNLYKVLVGIGIFVISIGIVWQLNNTNTPSTPNSLTFDQKLKYALSVSKINLAGNPDCNYLLNLCHLTINDNSHHVIALITTQTDPLYQVSSLQQILKIATIKHKHADFIDLSSPRPYATLKDN